MPVAPGGGGGASAVPARVRSAGKDKGQRVLLNLTGRSCQPDDYAALITGRMCVSWTLQDL